jgi:hypothetical protein
MGWNTWDCYGTLITEAEARENADCLAQRLLPFGWDHVVLDMNWYEPSRGLGDGLTDGGVRDEFGRYLPAPNRFPSAAGGAGFRPLADFVHSRGLKLGIHIMRGVPRRAVELGEPVKGTPFTADQIADLGSVCGWNTNNYGIDMSHPGAQAYYDSLLELYSAWEIDFIKADDMTRPEEIGALVHAIEQCGRPMTLSLVGINAPVPLSHPRARMYRISPDVWDEWDEPETPWCGVDDMFELAARFAPQIVEGCYPDADMLPIGRIGRNDAVGEERQTRLAPAEQTTLLTLWCMFRSPLMLGGSVVDLDDFTYSLLANPEALAVNQYSLGNRPLFTEAGRAAWVAQDTEHAATYLALFNRGKRPQSIAIDLNEIGLSGRAAARDLWQRRAIGTFEGTIEQTVAPHGAALLHLASSRQSMSGRGRNTTAGKSCYPDGRSSLTDMKP